jgi:hypothetical protein
VDGRLHLRSGKKLRAAGVHWARGGEENLDAARADLRKFGAAEAEIDRMLGPAAPADFEVWPDNWPAVEAFIAVQTQWATGMGGATGLDYARVRAGLAMAGIDVTPELFGQLRLLESGALEGLAKKAKA